MQHSLIYLRENLCNNPTMNDKKEIGEDGVSVQEAEGFDLDEQAKSTRKQLIIQTGLRKRIEDMGVTVNIDNFNLDRDKYDSTHNTIN